MYLVLSKLFPLYKHNLYLSSTPDPLIFYVVRCTDVAYYTMIMMHNIVLKYLIKIIPNGFLLVDKI